MSKAWSHDYTRDNDVGELSEEAFPVKYHFKTDDL
jgi:hypothetical protein